MTVLDTKDIFERNLSNALIQKTKTDYIIILRTLLRFALEAGFIEATEGIYLGQKIVCFGGIHDIILEDITKHITYRALEKNKCWDVFKSELVHILYYGSQETSNEAGIALLLLASDLGLIARSEKLFVHLLKLLQDGYHGVTREGLEDFVTWLETRYGQSKHE